MIASVEGVEVVVSCVVDVEVWTRVVCVVCVGVEAVISFVIDIEVWAAAACSVDTGVDCDIDVVSLGVVGVGETANVIPKIP